MFTSILGLLVVSIFVIVNYKKENFKERADTKEAVWFKEEKAAYLREINGENILGIYNEESKKEVEIEEVKGEIHSINWSPDGKYLTIDEGTGIIKITYIILISDLKVFDKLSTIGEVNWSPDSKKLLIGVENTKERKEKGELNGTVDLAVYYLLGNRAEPLLEAEEGFDYYPEYWKGDFIGYIKSSNGNKESLKIKYEPSLEENIMSIIMSKKEVEKEELRKILLSLPKVDLDNLERIYGDNSEARLLSWLKDQDISDIEDIKNLIKISLNIQEEQDNTISELMRDIYLKDKIGFIKALSGVPEAMENIAYSFRFLETYETGKDDITKDLNMFLGAEELTKKEKKMAVDFLNIYALCGT